MTKTISFRKFKDHCFSMADRKGIKYLMIEPQTYDNRTVSATCINITSGKVVAVWVKGAGIVFNRIND